MSEATPPGGFGSWRGTVAVVLIVALGIGGVIGARAWYNMQSRAIQQRQAVAGDAWDRQEAEQELAALAEVFQDAIAQGSDTASFVEPAERLIRQYPGFAEAHTLLAQVYRMRGRLPEAVEQLEASLALKPEQPNVHEMAGQLELEQQHFDRAISHYSQAMNLAPGDPRYQLFLAQVHITTQEYDTARRLLLNALNTDSSLHRAYAMLSDMYARQNRLDMALDQIGKAIENTPLGEREFRVTYIRTRSRLLRRANQPEEALLALEALSPRERADMDVIAEMAMCWTMMGRYGEAARIYEDAYLNNAEDFELLERAAEYRIRAGDRDRAVRYIELLRRQNPQSPVVRELESKLAEMDE